MFSTNNKGMHLRIIQTAEVAFMGIAVDILKCHLAVHVIASLASFDELDILRAEGDRIAYCSPDLAAWIDIDWCRWFYRVSERVWLRVDESQRLLYIDLETGTHHRNKVYSGCVSLVKGYVWHKSRWSASGSVSSRASTAIRGTSAFLVCLAAFDAMHNEIMEIAIEIMEMGIEMKGSQVCNVCAPRFGWGSL